MSEWSFLVLYVFIASLAGGLTLEAVFGRIEAIDPTNPAVVVKGTGRVRRD